MRRPRRPSLAPNSGNPFGEVLNALNEWSCSFVEPLLLQRCIKCPLLRLYSAGQSEQSMVFAPLWRCNSAACVFGELLHPRPVIAAERIEMKANLILQHVKIV